MIDAADLQDDLLTSGVMSRRVWAWLIDLLLIGITASAFFVVFFLFGLLTLGLGLPLLSLLPLVPLLYNFLFLAGPSAATPGQQMMGLVVCRDSDFGRPTPLQALLSVIGFYVTLATGAIWMAVALLTVRHRTLHDMFSGLVVVRAKALTAGVWSWNMPGRA
jgi:uncharacterized RDD family membrane protein YckC